MTQWFVGLSLFFPRLTLLWFYFVTGMPTNDTPFGLDVVAFLFAPRLLIAWWLYVDPTWHPLWSAIFVLFALFSSGSSSSAVSSSRKGDA